MKKRLFTLLILASFIPISSTRRKNFEFKHVPKNARVKKIHHEPLIYTIDNFISDEEGKKIIDLARPKMGRSLIYDDDLDHYRTSSTAFFEVTDDEVIKNVAERAAQLLGKDSSVVEFQVLHYKKGQQFKKHYDFFGDDMMKTRKSQRLTTLFVYLNAMDEDAGGETKFHELGTSVKPKKNTAVLWHNLDKDGELDYRTLHSGKPILKGEKWGINLWIHDQIPD